MFSHESGHFVVPPSQEQARDVGCTVRASATSVSPPRHVCTCIVPSMCAHARHVIPPPPFVPPPPPFVFFSCLEPLPRGLSFFFSPVSFSPPPPKFPSRSIFFALFFVPRDRRRGVFASNPPSIPFRFPFERESVSNRKGGGSFQPFRLHRWETGWRCHERCEATLVHVLWTTCELLASASAHHTRVWKVADDHAERPGRPRRRETAGGGRRRRLEAPAGAWDGTDHVHARRVERHVAVEKVHGKRPR